MCGDFCYKNNEKKWSRSNQYDIVEQGEKKRRTKRHVFNNSLCIF